MNEQMVMEVKAPNYQVEGLGFDANDLLIELDVEAQKQAQEQVQRMAASILNDPKMRAKIQAEAKRKADILAEENLKVEIQRMLVQAAEKQGLARQSVVEVVKAKEENKLVEPPCVNCEENQKVDAVSEKRVFVPSKFYAGGLKNLAVQKVEGVIKLGLENPKAMMSLVGFQIMTVGALTRLGITLV